MKDGKSVLKCCSITTPSSLNYNERSWDLWLNNTWKHHFPSLKLHGVKSKFIELPHFTKWLNGVVWRIDCLATDI